MRPWVRDLLMALAIFTGIVTIGCGLLVEFGLCRNTVVATIASPDRRHRAVVFERNCGATTDFSTQVTLDPLLSMHPFGGGNLWIADADHGAAPSASWGGPDVKIEWTSPTTLRLLRHRKVREFRAETSVHGVTITYDFLPDEGR
jgi:hypothetical protein